MSAGVHGPSQASQVFGRFNFSLKSLDCVLQDPELKVPPMVNQLPHNMSLALAAGT